MPSEEKDDWREILELPSGIFLVKYHRLSLKALRNRRSRLQNEMFKLRREIGQHYEQIDLLRSKLQEKEDMLSKLTDKKIQYLVEIEKKRQEEAELKATEFLKEYVGEDAYESLQKEGYFQFTGLDGNQYRIKKNGELQQAQGNYWYHCCVIRKELPLPDFIAAVFTAARTDPSFLARSMRRRTEEEVRT